MLRTTVMGMMGWMIAGSLLLGGPLAANADDASASELKRLENELEALQEDLQVSVEAPESFRARLDDLRMEVVYLKVKSRKYREAGGEGSGLGTDEIAEVSRELARLRKDLASSVDDPMLSLSIGTRFSARLMDSLSTRYTQTGAAFTAITNAAVTRGGQVVIPAGSVLYGVVEQVDRPDGRLDRSAKLVLAFERIEVDGYQYPLTATVAGASEKMESGLGDEKAKMGIGAGVGAVLGAVLGGKKGAVAGIILGGSGAVLATEGKNVELDRGTMLTLRLDRALDLPIAGRPVH